MIIIHFPKPQLKIYFITNKLNFLSNKVEITKNKSQTSLASLHHYKAFLLHRVLRTLHRPISDGRHPTISSLLFINFYQVNNYYLSYLVSQLYFLHQPLVDKSIISNKCMYINCFFIN